MENNILEEMPQEPEPDPDDEEISPISKVAFSPIAENRTAREISAVNVAEAELDVGEVEITAVDDAAPIEGPGLTQLGGPLAISLKTRRKHFCLHSEHTIFIYWSIIN